MKSAGKVTHSYKHFTLVRTHDGFFEFEHKKNKLRVLYHGVLGTGVVTANIVYGVGSRHELPGQTGLAHMLEHMLFKPTKTDISQRRSAAIMLLERDKGATINASTWKDRTKYFATVPTSLLSELLAIQADQMRHVVITEKSLASERSTVLSEYDMYNSDPYFALECAVSAAAYSAHPYRHETIGWRADIEMFTAEKLQAFYAKHYQPANATLVIVGDVKLEEVLKNVERAFGHITYVPKPTDLYAHEPPQEGIRRTSVVRPTTTNILMPAGKCTKLLSPHWLQTLVLLKILAGGPDSLLHRALVDTHKVASVDFIIMPTVEPFLATLVVTLVEGSSHDSIEVEVRNLINQLTNAQLKKPLKKTVAQILYAEPFSRDSSYSIATEITDYVVAGDWTRWCHTETLVKAITSKQLLTVRDQLFIDNNLTIGTFVGKQ